MESEAFQADGFCQFGELHGKSIGRPQRAVRIEGNEIIIHIAWSLLPSLFLRAFVLAEQLKGLGSFSQ